MTDVAKLERARRRAGLPKRAMAERLGMSVRKLEKKMQNRAEFTAREIAVLSHLLHLRPREREDIFFALCVDFTSTEGENYGYYSL